MNLHAMMLSGRGQAPQAPCCVIPRKGKSSERESGCVGAGGSGEGQLGVTAHGDQLSSRVIEKFWNQVPVLASQHCECMECPTTVHFKMVKKIPFYLVCILSV